MSSTYDARVIASGGLISGVAVVAALGEFGGSLVHDKKDDVYFLEYPDGKGGETKWPVTTGAAQEAASGLQVGFEGISRSTWKLPDTR